MGAWTNAGKEEGGFLRLRLSTLPLVACLLLALALCVAPVRAQPTPPDTSYRVYTGAGAPASLDAVVAAMDTVEVVFLGEVHNDPTAHALHRALLARAHRRYGAADSAAGRSVALSLESFERDVQPVLDEYLAGLITEEHFLASSRPWRNYRAAYRPLVEYAKAHELAVLAANAPRRYVNRVARLGPSSLDSLPHAAEQWLPPLPPPPPSDAYRAKWKRHAHAAMTVDSSGASPHGASPDTTALDSARVHDDPHHGASADNMLRAQALWDATMAYAIATHLMDTPRALVLHVTGGFHVSEGTGTPEQLARYRPSARPLVVVMRPVDDVAAFDPDAHAALGDFVVLTDAARVRERPPTEPGK